MITISEFIKKKIQSIPSVNKNTIIRYCYEEKFKLHVIVVSPASEMVENELLVKWESEFWDEYFEDYSDEDMLITGDDDIEIYNLNEICNSNQKPIISWHTLKVINSNNFQFNYQQDEKLKLNELDYAFAA